MIKQLLAELATFGFLSSAPFAQTYIPVSPPPAAVAPPSVGVPGSTITTKTTSPTADHATTITKGVDTNGNEITKKDTYREGITGSTESHTTTFTDPDGGTTTTRSKTTNKPE